MLMWERLSFLGTEATKSNKNEKRDKKIIWAN